MASNASKAFDMGKMAMGGIGQVLDSVDFVKRAWGGLNLPSTLVPTVDIDELDKRIADLKAVEQWLNMNLSMLRGTIQGLEIQRGTLAAVKAFGASFGPQAQPAEAPAAAPARTAARAPAPPPAPAAEPDEPAEAPAAKATGRPAGGKPASPKPELPPTMLPGINPTAWWNLLQQNFNQVAQSALTGGGLQDAAVTAMKTAGELAGAAMPRAAKAGAAGTRAAPAPAARKAPAPRKPAAKPRRAPPKRAPKAGS
ncbi:MAG: hypothetical protein EHM87_09880 [Burkholderiales bacterium]|nr:MAG: hypothetical protein EHM87_09880 [Burkholderiales bacterium]